MKAPSELHFLARLPPGRLGSPPDSFCCTRRPPCALLLGAQDAVHPVPSDWPSALCTLTCSSVVLP